jgi:hypothetical protein
MTENVMIFTDILTITVMQMSLHSLRICRHQLHDIGLARKIKRSIGQKSDAFDRVKYNENN